MRRLILVPVLMVTAFASGGCKDHSDVRARYMMERKLWHAQTYERRINISFLRASQRDIANAISAFSGVIESDPLADGIPPGWSPAVAGEISRISMTSKIALANLYFLSERYNEAGEHYTSTLADTHDDLKQSLRIRLSLARSMHLAGNDEELTSNCERIFRDIASSDDFWNGQFELDEVFISIPLVLARVYHDRNDRSTYESFSAVARKFYDRVTATWPDDSKGAQAQYALANLYLLRGEWQSAITTLESLMENPHYADRRWRLELLRGEILAYALKDVAGGRESFTRLMGGELGGGPFASHSARYNLAVLELRHGDRDKAMNELRRIETAEPIIPDIAARAMVLRASEFEKEGEWDDALLLLRRVTRMYPFTRSATEAPLMITRHYVSTGDEALARRSLEKARDYYISLMESNSKFAGDRLSVEDLLVENYVLTGQAREVAELLGTAPAHWDDVTTAGGMFRAALIYSDILDDPENAARTLEKCIELFPETRYAKIARAQLDRLRNES